jgi:hypothetical protein
MFGLQSSHTQTLMQRAYLLLGEKCFDSGNLKGFLRQYGVISHQRFVLYKPYDDESAYRAPRLAVPQRELVAHRVRPDRAHLCL